MPTDRMHGFLDALRGSTTEQVLHQADCSRYQPRALGCQARTAAIGTNNPAGSSYSRLSLKLTQMLSRRNAEKANSTGTASQIVIID